MIALLLLGALPIDRELDVLPPEPREALRIAGEKLAGRKLTLGGFDFDGALLGTIAASDEPILRAVREGLHRPIDLSDFLLFLDDVVRSGERRVVVTSDRARAHGLFLHPGDVFFDRPKRYAEKMRSLPIDDPPVQTALEPAEDGDLLGPRWTARFQQPATYTERLAELEAKNPRFGKSVRALVEQLEAQGAAIVVESAVRSRARGYLIYGSYLVSRAKTARALERRIRDLERYNREWNLSIPIVWRHPDGFSATVEAARRMADTYGVDFATLEGAKRSDHYDAKAVDLVAVDLPRKLELVAPDGARKVFDLSAPEESRDLNLSPALITWIERHFRIRKLRSDYPHWRDRR